MTQEFLRSQPGLDIPLVKEMRRLSEPTDKVHLVLMSRAEGETLDKAWPTLSEEEKSSIRIQLVNIIKQLRQFTAPAPQRVDGSPIDDNFIGICGRRPSCFNVGSTTDEWFNILEDTIRNGLIEKYETKDTTFIDEKYQELKSKFPKSEPYVLSHGDLDFGNIIVKGGKIEAIIEWEYAGYLPWWAERRSSLQCRDEHTDELWQPIWEMIEPEWDRTTFGKEISSAIYDASMTFREAKKEHENDHAIWSRPPFCECKPYQGGFRLRDLGFPNPHKLIERTQFPGTGITGAVGDFVKSVFFPK
jgi:hypothetical protein